MLLNKIEEKLYDLLINKNDEVVISISGEWGIGKTYFWKEIFLDKYKEELKDKKIAYISLFGMESLNDIRTSIVFQLSPTKNKINWLNKKSKNLLNGFKNTFKSDDISMSFGLNTISSILSILASGDFKNVIICFDDFERISSKIDLKDILGLISELKEQKKCKVIMILNEKELEKLSNIEGEKHSDIFKTYKEKIIDIDLLFEPSVDESFKNAITNLDIKFDKNIFKDIFNVCEVKNIRVIRQVLYEIDNFSYITRENYDEKVIRDFLSTAIKIFILIKKDLSIENYLKIKKENHFSTISDEKFEKIEEDILNRKDIKNNYFNNIDSSIEPIIIEYIRTDKILKDELRNILNDKNQYLNRYEVEKKISAIWHKLYVDFKYKIEDFTNELIKIFRDNINDIHNILNIEHFHNYIIFLKEHNTNIESEFIDKIIKNYIDKFLKQEKYISTYDENNKNLIKEKYPRLLEYWENKKQEKLIDEISENKIIEILDKVISGWSPKDEYILNNIKTSIYQQYIELSPNFTSSIIRFLSSKSINDIHFKNAIKNIKEALENLRTENDDYKFKVDKIFKETNMQ